VTSAQHSDVVIVGAGMVGAATGYAATNAGLTVTVIDRSGVAAGTTGAGEGNILVSDKEPGPELDLALWSNQLWREWGAALDDDSIELEPKGGLVVASRPQALAALKELAAAQARAGVAIEDIPASALRDLEPRLTENLAGGVRYPQDMQVQPMLAAARLLRAAQDKGAKILKNTEMLGVRAGSGAQAVSAARTTTTTGASSLTLTTSHGDIHTRYVVNAAGTWGGEVSKRLGAEIPVLPRRGFILVTEPLPPKTIRHKVYTADYVANVASGDEGLETSTVIESTQSGTILIGATRERVGFDRTLSIPALRKLAQQATELFPFLADVSAIRAYRGFRPYCPDHLPVIGPDTRIAGVLHACGHEGAGIGLAPATGTMIANLITENTTSPVDPAHFSPARFAP
jgi:glycine/D-amino acid oxidase-like deaminating enzyme